MVSNKIDDQPISTTITLEHRGAKLSLVGVTRKTFRPHVLELVKDFAAYTGGGKHHKTGGEHRLRDLGFQQRLVNELVKARQEHPDYTIYYLVKLPVGSTPAQNDQYRTIIADLQIRAGMERIYVPVAPDEQSAAVKRHIIGMKLPLPVVLVLWQHMVLFKSLRDLVVWGAAELDEVAVFYMGWKEYAEEFDMLITRAEEYPLKLYMSSLPMSLTVHSDALPLGPYLIAKEFKGISVVNPPIPGYVLKHLVARGGGRIIPKTASEQYADAVWLDNGSLVTVVAHPNGCACFGSVMTAAVTEQQVIARGVYDCISHHNLEVLARMCALVRTNAAERQRVLDLEVFKALRQMKA